MSSPEVAAPTSRAGSGTLQLLGNELATQFRRWRTWAMLAALALIPILLGIAVRIVGGSRPGRGPAFLDQITDNGLFVALAALTVAIPLFLPLTVSVAAGDAIAGEASHGTLRYLLIAPAGRVRLLLVKYLSAVAFCLAATAHRGRRRHARRVDPLPGRPGHAALGCAGVGRRGAAAAARRRGVRVGVALRPVGDRTVPLDAHDGADRRDGGDGDPGGRRADRRGDPAAGGTAPVAVHRSVARLR